MAFKWFRKKKSDKEKKDTDAMETPVTDEAEPPEAEPDGEMTPDPVSEVPEETLPAPETEPVEEQPAPGTGTMTPKAKPEKSGFFSRLKRGLSKTRAILTTDLDELFAGKSALDDDMLEELEELLITADIGVKTSMDIIEKFRKNAAGISSAAELKAALKKEIVSLFDTAAPDETNSDITAKPHVIMIVGVNGVGKTTTIGKLSAKMKSEGKSVLISAADTFRAAAVEQLQVWADRSGADLVRHKENADPAAVAYDSIEASLARNTDVVFVDTAGRLHTKVNLMEELKKIKRTIAKRMPGCPHEILLVLDATTGQNALAQAKMFDESLGVTGIVLTKLDGTAKGGIVISIRTTLNLPLKYIGVGEKIEDLQTFDPEQYVNALF